METTLPRRTLRKGTTSCIECKRRKIRCFFDQNSSVTCVSCQNRGTPCFSQESSDVSMPRDWENTERLKRMEKMLEDLTRQLNIQDRSVDLDETLDAEDYGSSNSEGATADITSFPVRVSQTALPARDRMALPKYAEACRTIHAAFPPQEAVTRIFSDARASIYLQALCNSYQVLFADKNTQSSAALARIPPRTAHPVLLARKMIHLALCMQQLDPSFDCSTLQGITDVHESMNRYYELASRLVTCHDELLDSVEGIECLICEAVFLVNGGNLRQAIAALRRTTTVGLMIQMHKKPHNIPLKKLDPNTRVHGQFTWTHIVYLERYVSLLLGMPSTVAINQPNVPPKKEEEGIEEWFERSQIDICNRIITRNQTRQYDIATTMEIDKRLNGTTAQTVVEWWAPLRFTPDMVHEKMMSLMLSAQMQIIHFNMLTVLHLPHLLCRDTVQQTFAHSRSSCFFASRQVLTRFIAFRSHIKVVYCCRPVDFCAFTAAMTLLLAYLNRDRTAAGHEFVKQRSADLGLIKSTLRMLDELTRLNGDELSAHTAKLTRKMLELEESVERYRGDVVYDVVVDKSSTKAGGREQGNDALYLDIPYFGCIKMSAAQSTKNASLPTHYGHHRENAQQNQGSSFLSIQPFQAQDLAPGNSSQVIDPVFHMALYGQEPAGVAQGGDWPMPDLLAGSDEWAFQGVDTAFFDSVMTGCDGDFAGDVQWNTGRAST